MKKVFCFIILNLFFIPLSLADDATLTFIISDQKKTLFALSEMKKKCKPQIIAFVDPIYKKRKRYEAFELKPLLTQGFGEEWKDSIYTDIVFKAIDGFEAVAPLKKFEENGAYLAFRDLDFADWEPLERKQIIPGPLYIVWMGAEQTQENGYPWPFQVESMKLVTFDEQYTRVIPTGASKDSLAYKGFEIFKQECFRCHSMNQQGGKVGPDLNAPLSVIEYRQLNQLKDFIRQPSKFRFTNMPDQPFLKDQDIEALIAYFKLKSKQPKQ